MIRTISVQNFKPFTERVSAPLAPITLLYGPNSAGKSAIIQSLMLLKQTFATELYGTEPGTLAARGHLVDLGSFRSLVSYHDLDREVRIGLRFTPNPRRVSPRAAIPMNIERELEVVYAAPPKKAPGRNHRANLTKVSYEAHPPDRDAIRIALNRGKPRNDYGETHPAFVWETNASRESFKELALYTLEHANGGYVEQDEYSAWLDDVLANVEFPLVRPLPDLLKPTQALEEREVRALAKLHNLSSRVLSSISSEYIRLLDDASYLGPLRSHPARQYLSTGYLSRSVGKSGEQTPHVLAERLKLRTRQINDWFRQLEIPYTMRVKDIGDEVVGRAIALLLKDQRSNVTVTSADVGFGIGQLLPILVEGMARQGSCICVEQPEIHLHPRLQGALGDFFLETAIRRPPRERNQWIVETHSETLMLRLMRRVREGLLSPTDLSVLYVEPSSSGTKLHELRLDRDGDFLDEWPDGFFEEDFREVFWDELQ